MRPDTERQVIIDDGDAMLYWHAKPKIVHHELKGIVQGQRFRQLLEKGLELFREHGACKWLSDDRGNTALSHEDTDWAINVWSPQVIAAGWKYWAVVMPKKMIGQMDMTGWIKRYAEKGVTVSAFTDPDAALRWLSVR